MYTYQTERMLYLEFMESPQSANGSCLVNVVELTPINPHIFAFSTEEVDIKA